MARDRAELLLNRLGKRLAQLDAEAQISAKAPILKSGALIIPAGLLRQTKGETPNAAVDAEARKRVELLAMEAVFAAERAMGRTPIDKSAERGIGYDVLSTDSEGNQFFIEVKGRAEGADSVTLTFNELKCGNNMPKSFRLASSTISGDQASPPRYVSGIDWGRPGFASQGQIFTLSNLLSVAGDPH